MFKFEENKKEEYKTISGENQEIIKNIALNTNNEEEMFEIIKTKNPLFVRTLAENKNLTKKIALYILDNCTAYTMCINLAKNSAIVDKDIYNKLYYIATKGEYKDSMLKENLDLIFKVNKNSYFKKYIDFFKEKNKILITIELMLITLFLTTLFNFYKIDSKNLEYNYYLTTKENYKYLDNKKELNISYKGLSEIELFNRYSKLETDKILIDEYISFINNKISFKELSEKQNYILNNIKDIKLKKSLELNFKGIDLSFYEFINYKYYSEQNKRKMLLDLMIFIVLFIVLFLVFITSTKKKL
jgi:hypothetical protein